MDLDQARAVLRPRTPWEGVDLGFALARQWFLPLWALWWLTALPLGAVAGVWLRGRPDLWLTLLWWLKPLFETLPLLWLSRALFGAPPPLRGDPRGWGAAVLALVDRVQVPRLLPYLLWRRLAPSRSLDLPVSLLEGQRGRGLRERRRVLHGGDGTGAWLTLIGVHLEMILGLGGLLTLFFLIPAELPRLDLEAALFEPGSWAYWVACLLSLVAMSIMAPFYVAGGFALYLTRRTQLEAWDLELVFRRAARAQAAASRTQRWAPGRARAAVRATTSAAVPILALALTALVPAPGPALAAGLPSADEAKALIAEVLAGPDFGAKREVKGWAYVGSGEPKANAGNLDLGWLRNLADWIAAAAGPVRWGLALAAAVLVALLLHRILHKLPGDGWGRLRTRQRRGQAPESLGTTPTAAPLPEDVPAAVRAMLAAGETRAALALLYRAGIARLRGLGLTLAPGATEGECLRLAARTRPAPEVAYLRRLTHLWQGLAYAHRTPDRHDLEALLEHWQDWGAWVRSAGRGDEDPTDGA